jgi:hypothetical protein
MDRIEVFRLLQDVLVVQQPFRVAKRNPQLLKTAEQSTADWVLAGIYDLGAFHCHLPGIYPIRTLLDNVDIYLSPGSSTLVGRPHLERSFAIRPGSFMACATLTTFRHFGPAPSLRPVPLLNR